MSRVAAIISLCALIALSLGAGVWGRAGDTSGGQASVMASGQVLDQTEPPVGMPDAAADDCDSETEHGKKLKCKSEELVDELCGTVDLLASADLGPLASEVADDLEGQCAIANGLVDATTPEEFKALGLNRNASTSVVAEYVGADKDDEDVCSPDPCPVPEWSPGEDALTDAPYLGEGYSAGGDLDGICKVARGGPRPDQGHGAKLKGYNDEWCAEVIGDGIGDDDGFCEEHHVRGEPKFEEPCVMRPPDVGQIDADDENFNTGRLVMMEQVLDEATEGAVAANAAIARNLEVATSLASISDYSPEECDGVFDDVTFTRHPYDILKLKMALSVGAEHLYMATDAGLNQDVFGSNGSVAGAAFAVLADIATSVWQLEELTDDFITSERVDNGAKCLEYLGDRIDELGDEIAEINGKLDEVIILLNMPPGQRPEFPIAACDNDGRCDQNETAASCPADCP